MSKQIEKAQQRIMQIKKDLLAIGPMRPGRLAQQKRKNRNGKLYGSYWQLGYTYKMKSRSHYVPDNLFDTVREQTEAYRRFKSLTEEWLDLALMIAQHEFEQAKSDLKNEA
jgi:hypothetical protein